MERKRLEANDAASWQTIEIRGRLQTGPVCPGIRVFALIFQGRNRTTRFLLWLTDETDMRTNGSCRHHRNVVNLKACSLQPIKCVYL